MPSLPFAIREYPNPRTGSISYQVTGSHETLGRIRKNFSEAAAAEMYCTQQNNAALQSTQPKVEFAQTRLTLQQVAEAESGVTRSRGRWTLGQIVDAGLNALESHKPAQPVGPLYQEFQAMVDKEFGVRFALQIRTVCGMFFRDHPVITTEEFGRATIRAWLDKAKIAPATKRNRRGALSRFGSWLQEKLNLDANPVAGIKLSKSKRTGFAAKMPAVFSALQAEAYLRAVQQPQCRRVKGWAALCLFGGLRPNSEALHLTWSEVKLDKGEISVMGTKRGAKPRVLPINPTLRAWLLDAKKDGEEVPGFFSRSQFRESIKVANDWLADNYPDEPDITWEPDIQRHTYASMRAGTGVNVSDLVEEMGTSEKTYYAHYKNPRPADQVKKFWALRPA